TDQVPSILGTLVIVARDGRLCAVDFDDCRPRMVASIEWRYGTVEFQRTPDPFGMGTKILAYLAGDLRAIDTLAVETGGTPFQQTWGAPLGAIPAGKPVTYADLAERSDGRPRSEQ